MGQPGDTRAYDARTGAKLWDFHTVPRPGEVGHETWLNDGWKGRSGTNVWAWQMTVDEQRGILYMPVGRTGFQLLRRRPAGRESVRQFRGGRGCRDRESSNGISRPSITICGITILRRRRC